MIVDPAPQGADSRAARRLRADRFIFALTNSVATTELIGAKAGRKLQGQGVSIVPKDNIAWVRPTSGLSHSLIRFEFQNVSSPLASRAKEKE
jgi:hypothetical protein